VIRARQQLPAGRSTGKAGLAGVSEARWPCEFGARRVCWIWWG